MGESVGSSARQLRAHLDMLPHVRLRVDDAHVWLVRAAVHEHAVVHLEEGVLRVVLRAAGSRVLAFFSAVEERA